MSEKKYDAPTLRVDGLPDESRIQTIHERLSDITRMELDLALGGVDVVEEGIAHLTDVFIEILQNSSVDEQRDFLIYALELQGNVRREKRETRGRSLTPVDFFQTYGYEDYPKEFRDKFLVTLFEKMSSDTPEYWTALSPLFRTVIPLVASGSRAEKVVDEPPQLAVQLELVGFLEYLEVVSRRRLLRQIPVEEGDESYLRELRWAVWGSLVLSLVAGYVGAESDMHLLTYFGGAFGVGMATVSLLTKLSLERYMGMRSGTIEVFADVKEKANKMLVKGNSGDVQGGEKDE